MNVDREAITQALLQQRGTRQTNSAEGEAWLLCRCLFHRDDHRSASWQPDTGNFYCHAEARSFSVPEVLKALHLAAASRSNGQHANGGVQPQLRAQARTRAGSGEQVPAPGPRVRKGDPVPPEVVTVWEYRHPDGRLGHRKIRRDPGKRFSQIGPDGDLDSADQHRPPVTWPLYGDFDGPQGAIWVVVEGEKSCDYLNGLKLEHQGAPVRALTAGSSAELQAAAETLAQRLHDLEAKLVLPWPDQDQPGEQAMAAVLAALRRQSLDFLTVDARELGLQEHWGADDWLQQGGDLLQVLAAEKPAERQPPAPQDFFGEQGFMPAWLGHKLTEDGGLQLGHDGRIYRYRDGAHRPDGESWTKVSVRDLLGERFRRRHLEETLTWIRADLPSIGTQQPERWINCRNGLIDWRRQEFHSHDPGVLSTIQIPVAWRPEATCERFDRFLAEVLPADTAALVWELIGYCLFPGNPYQKAVLLLGPGGNGKGVLLGVMRALLGPENTSTLTLHNLAENRFSAADLYGRLANICGDLDARSVERSDLFKQITGGDAISAERKYGSPFSFIPHAKLIFAANEPPPTSDQSLAYFDRWVVVPMTRRIRGSAQEDPGLLQRLTGDLEGVLVKAVAGLGRLFQRGHFDLPAVVLEAGQAFHDRLDSVSSFLDEECGLVSGGWVARPEVYRAYQDWCQENGRQRLNSATFYDRLLAAADLEIAVRDDARGFAGLVLHPE